MKTPIQIHFLVTACHACRFATDCGCVPVSRISPTVHSLNAQLTGASPGTT
jgi:hypothetical protein